MRVIITGASRGIGKAFALKFAQAGAHVALLARSETAPSHQALKGTLQDVKKEVEAAGGRASIYGVDLTDGVAFQSTLHRALEDLGGCDVLINNASVVNTSNTQSPKQLDLLHSVNTRAVMTANQTCRSALVEADGSILTMSPPIRLGRLSWIYDHIPYTVSKYGMTIATLGESESVNANCLWPRRTVATAATEMLEKKGFKGAYSAGRPAAVVADAGFQIATSREWNAQTLFDDDIISDWRDDRTAPLDVFATEDVSALRTN